tara:strand:- start:4359 stop:5126 length:768 start_codon:yes stop_codon:yes gene_type:complete
MNKISVEKIIKLKNTSKITMITAYDFVSGHIVNNSDAEMILVGDSLGMTTLGYEFTNSVKLDDIIRATQSIARVGISKLLVADLPYKTYETNESALSNALMLIDAGADAVKLEGGKEKSQIINFLVQNNIQVMGHIGIKPQSVNNISDYKIVGKNKSEEDNLFEDAKRIELSGAFSVVLELVDSKLSKNISENISIPTIGISSGKYTDGQVQVYNDLIGYSPNILPKHAKVFDNLFEKAQNAIDSFVKETKSKYK